MVNPRLFLQLPLLMLGSCTPVIPSTSIVIYNTETRTAEVRRVDEHPSAQQLTQKTALLTEDTCKILELAAVRTYSLPPIPDLTTIDPDDTKAQADALFDNIVLLRAELNRLHKEYLCSREHPSRN